MQSNTSLRSSGTCWNGTLWKDCKPISDIQSFDTPIPLPGKLTVKKFEAEYIYPLNVLQTFELYPVWANPTRLDEWCKFLKFLMQYHRVAYVVIPGFELLINPPAPGVIKSTQKVVVSYRQKMCVSQNIYMRMEKVPNAAIDDLTVKIDPVKPILLKDVKKNKKLNCRVRRHAQAHPSYLETLGQSHASWIFGALAELIDNARDAKATRLDITIDQEFLKSLNVQIPVLSVSDNGTGMTHSDVLQMVSFGHKRPEYDKNMIGRFGVGFKTGTMRLGKDAVVFTQSQDTRTIAFLSRSYNEGKNEVEIPIITYRKQGGWMDFDLRVHSQEEAEASLSTVKKYSPFNEYNIGSRFAALGDSTGTTVCIYNLDRWGSDYSLQWDPKAKGTECEHGCDITIRSRRVRTRPSQMTKEVPLDYSLRAYLEVIFLEPRMKIYIQGTQVKTRRLHKSLNKTKVFKGTLLAGQKVELTLGRSQIERDRGNCGIFLYWHGRLIEAYKRVGGMIHSADVGRGVIGVIDVTDIMKLEDGVAVLNNKQGFQDCEAYAVLDEWLGNMANQYWDENFDPLEVEKRNPNAQYTPDHTWVQCNKCLKWRILDAHYNEKDLPDDWFCYLPPFNGSCMMPELEPEAGIVTVGAARSHVSELGQKEELDLSTSSMCNKESSAESKSTINEVEIKAPTLRRLKRGPSQAYQPANKRSTTPSW